VCSFSRWMSGEAMSALIVVNSGPAMREVKQPIVAVEVRCCCKEWCALNTTKAQRIGSKVVCT
jgi:hypothetical protein